MFRFTIRDVLWLTVVVAMGAGWFMDRMRWQATISAYRADYQELQATAARLDEKRAKLLWQTQQGRQKASPDEN